MFNNLSHGKTSLILGMAVRWCWLLHIFFTRPLIWVRPMAIFFNYKVFQFIKGSFKNPIIKKQHNTLEFRQAGHILLTRSTRQSNVCCPTIIYTCLFNSKLLAYGSGFIIFIIPPITTWSGSGRQGSASKKQARRAAVAESMRKQLTGLQWLRACGNSSQGCSG